ncbi:glycosyltransferase family protein [Aspergillus campestris IBT 28561]|uniref:UDP-N-acetylglucosamine transferase subunit ALG14 n=1 Tax=Aspergillus campestris (strain IBT 28561) TaxID=1392248 RepID=A0A2I1D2F8_ASPC2|nr:glycosyltransferase family protein [Aspergillus campestris IBT 28561]PKY04054.1 glycosyltransferase family protein [Aspergillus campestris IBT 28561]
MMAEWLSFSFSFLCWGLVLGGVAAIVIVLLLFRALTISHHAAVPKWRLKNSPAHLLVVLGSGGHTAEMFSMLRRMELDPSRYTYRTYLVSSGDNFSAAKAVEFETDYLGQRYQTTTKDARGSYTIVTVPRARRVHQSYLTAPFSTLQSFWACLLVLRGLHPDQKLRPPYFTSPYPDIVLTNGPATAVCVILAARLLRLYNYLVAIFEPRRKPTSSGSTRSDLQLRTIFVESWARVTTLSLSGKILLPFADRFLVQWPALGGKQMWKGMRKTEYVGTLVD